jgi:hypothetical protein
MSMGFGIFTKEASLTFIGMIVQNQKDGAFGLGWFLCRCLSSLEAYATYYPFNQRVEASVNSSAEF